MSHATRSSPGAPPLRGVRVIGLEQSVAGPLCTRILADMGATVTKWERAGEGDFARHWDDHAAGESAQFWWLNRGKGSVAVDLSDAGQRDAFMAQLHDTDVLVLNMSPRAAGRLGLTERRMREEYPQLVVCHISGYGAETSFADRKAYDMLVQAESGIMSLTGTPDTPTRVGVSMCDVASGIYAATLVVAAVHRLRQDGHGAFLDVAMLDVAAEFLGPMLTSAANAGITYPRMPQHHHAIAPYGVYPCTDGKVLLAIEQDAEWSRFCDQILHASHLAHDERFISNLDRVRNREAVDQLVREAFASVTVDEAVELLATGGFAYARLNDVGAVLDHPVLGERGIVQTVPARGAGSVTTIDGLAARAFGTVRMRERPPTLGEDGNPFDHQALEMLE
ncbi:CaiB/BaiF CoA transferase family protein [Euzebya tangerina]|uniref:CaiB/BaiF CoA transferase family protein n=1 Tax=Euzebya tangerina TaxID=591198 RepID=UPI0013C36C8D|nr:CoA transferase [Euzebya tangerina]